MNTININPVMCLKSDCQYFHSVTLCNFMCYRCSNEESATCARCTIPQRVPEQCPFWLEYVVSKRARR